MILKYFRNLSSVACCWPARPLRPRAAERADDQALLGALRRLPRGQRRCASRATPRTSTSHVLKPWVDYWRIALRLEDAQRRGRAGVPAAIPQRLRRRAAARRLAAGARQAARLAGVRARGHAATRARTSRSAATRCLARLAGGDDSALAAIESIWLEPKELPEGCARFAEAVIKRERISTTAIWQRVRVLFENGQITAAKTALGYLPKGEAPDERALAEAARQPKRLSRAAAGEPGLAGRCARWWCSPALRYARDDPEALAKMLEGALGDRLPPAELKYLWGRVAYEGARSHHELALKWYARAERPAARPTRRTPGRRAPRCAAASGRRCARRSTACRPRRAAIRPGPTGTAARWRRRATTPARAPTSCASPASRTSTACSPTRSSATSPRCPRRCYVPTEQDLAGGQRTRRA